MDSLKDEPFLTAPANAVEVGREEQRGQHVSFIDETPSVTEVYASPAAIADVQAYYLDRFGSLLDPPAIRRRTSTHIRLHGFDGTTSRTVLLSSKDRALPGWEHLAPITAGMETWVLVEATLPGE